MLTIGNVEMGGVKNILRLAQRLDILHNGVDSVKKNLQLDWTKKEDARAVIRLAVKKEFRGKVPFSEMDNLRKEVIEQAEGQYRDWPLEA